MNDIQKITLYGIPNCDTVKKARMWLDEANAKYTFHNFKKDGLTSSTIEAWLTQFNLDTLINRKGLTWRGLTDVQKLSANNTQSAIVLMIAFPSIIKRPVLHIQGSHSQHFSVGFNPDLFTSIFKHF